MWNPFLFFLQMCNGLEQPRKQQRSDLNGPADNNNPPEVGTWGCQLCSCSQAPSRDSSPHTGSLLPLSHTNLSSLSVPELTIDTISAFSEKALNYTHEFLLPRSFYVTVYGMYSSLNFSDDMQSRENTSEVLFLGYWSAKVASKRNCVLLPFLPRPSQCQSWLSQLWRDTVIDRPAPVTEGWSKGDIWECRISCAWG